MLKDRSGRAGRAVGVNGTVADGCAMLCWVERKPCMLAMPHPLCPKELPVLLVRVMCVANSVNGWWVNK